MADEPSSSQAFSTDRSSLDDNLKPPQAPEVSGFGASGGGDFQTLPYMYPTFVPELLPLLAPDQMNHGPGIYAVPVLPNTGLIGVPFNNLIPLTYNIPSEPSVSEAGGSGGEQRTAGQQQQPQLQQPPQAEPQRQVVVRRFQIAFQIDLFLVLKLAAVIFLFNQDGSRRRLVLLVFFAAIVYLYQTGALTPLIRWISQAMRRAAAPPHPRRGRADNVHGAAQQGHDNANVTEGPAGAGNENPPMGDVNEAVENENIAERGGGNGGNRWWGIVKEIQMIVFGFVTSLLPGFHNHLD